jgi:hypothetical protein
MVQLSIKQAYLNSDIDEIYREEINIQTSLTARASIIMGSLPGTGQSDFDSSWHASALAVRTGG